MTIALQNAAPIASLILTTDARGAELPIGDVKPDPAGDMGI